MDIGAAEYMMNNIYCNLTVVGDSFDASTLGFVFPKNWLHIQDFDINVLALREFGELDILKKKWFLARSCEAAGEASVAMGVESMAGLFLTVGLITVVALLAFIWNKRANIVHHVSSLIDRRRRFVQNPERTTRSSD